MNEPDRQEQTLQRRSYELSILNDVARELNASVDLPSLLTRALEKVAELLDLHTGWVLLFDEVTGEPQLAAAKNLPPGLADEPERMTGGCLCLNTFCQGDFQGAANIDIVTCSRLKQLMNERSGEGTGGLRFHASIPLKVSVGDDASTAFKRLGMLNVASPEWRELTDDELNLLRTIGDLLGVAIERARLHGRRLEAAQTKERNRMAREIHDTIAQDFSAIAFRLEAAEAILEQEGNPERISSNIAASLDLARKGLEAARRSVLDLRAAPLEGSSLPEALSALTEEAAVVNPAAVVFSCTSPARSLPPAVEIGLYRIAQEALQNALRHAEAARIEIHLDMTSDEIRLTVEDDGWGFDVGRISDSRAAGRFGLVGMRERARLFGGRLHIESTPDTGTRITAHVPLSPLSSS